MTPSRENQENDCTVISNEPALPVESLVSQPQQQRRSTRRRCINPKLLKAADANDAMITTPKRRKVANSEQKAQAVAAPAENATADMTPRKQQSKKTIAAKEPSTSTRKSARNSTTAASKDKPPTPLSTRARKGAGKVVVSKNVASTPPSPRIPTAAHTTERVLPPSALKSARKLHKPSEKVASVLIPSHDSITVDTINETVLQLFESEEFQVLDRRCILARLFACFFLHTGDATASTTTLHSILPLLKVLVHVETTALGPAPLPTNSPPPPPTKGKRRVEFSAYDCSSTKPPVDREPTSDVHQQETIDALISAKEEIQLLKMGAVAAIQKLNDFLDCLLRDDYLLQTTAAAISPDFPTKRVSSLTRVQSRDFQILQKRLSKLPGDTFLSPLQCSLQSMMASPDYEPMSVEQNLSELLGQAIRFQLRKLLNAKPVRLSKVNEGYDEMAETCYSKVNSLIKLTSSSGVNIPVNDVFLSAPFSIALQLLYEYFDLPKLLESSNAPLQLPTSFCASEPSQRELSIRSRNAEPLSPQDVETVLDDIHAATSFLAAARAARFLLNLLAAPGVQDEITRMGGWGEIETYASCIWKNDFWQLCEADAHLVSLCNVSALHRRLEVYCTAMEALTDACEESLKQLHDNLHLSTKSTALLRSYPCIKVMAESFQQGTNLANSLPHVEPA